ncbi:hypothetical protein BGX31_010670 [Mortierella sp. GBA43]|nr:hypothetical protein BGX31_010670 [Mortierella sp. GBA43]
MGHHKFDVFLEHQPDLSVICHFDFFASVPNLSEADACNIWLSSLTDLAKSSATATKASATLLIKKYHEDKIDGTLRQYWDRRRLEQAAKKSKEEVELQTTVTVNRTTTRVMQSAEKQANDHLEKFDESISSDVAESLLLNKRKTGAESPASPVGQKHSRDPLSDQDEGPSSKLPRYTSSLEDDIHDDSTANPNSPQLYSSDQLSTDPADPSFAPHEHSELSTTRMFAWNFLEGNGRLDSNVDNPWVYDNTEISRDLMEFRDRVIQDNGSLTEPHEKLAVNFVFLVEADHQTRGLQAEMEDESWIALCDTTRDQVDSLPDVVVLEAHRWAHFLAHEKPESVRARLNQSPPADLSLKSILTQLTSTGRLWSDQASNEDTYIKSHLGPFLDTYLGNINYATSAWKETQEETRDPDSRLLVPDFTTTTLTSRRQLSLVLLEGKIDRNKTQQIWDDKTKLGQEMKLALDSILLHQPEDEVSVVGILVCEPRIEFFTMRIKAEATYIMRRFAVCHVPADSMNMFPIIHLMEAFHHAQATVEKTVAAIRRVKVRPGTNPVVPLSWIRPSYTKPRLTLVVDGE